MKLQLVDNDCFKTDGEPYSAINAASFDEICGEKKCTAMTFNQFAFVGSDGSHNPDLIFKMTCTISIGEANCLSKKRRSIGKSKGFIDSLLNFGILFKSKPFLCCFANPILVIQLLSTIMFQLNRHYSQFKMVLQQFTKNLRKLHVFLLFLFFFHF